MSHRNKKHHKRLQESERNVQPGTELNSVGENASNHKGLLLGIAGLGVGLVGVAAYLIGTERGQAIQERIGETVKDSACRVQDAAIAGWTRVRDFVMEIGEESEEQSAMEEEDSFEAMPDRFRRVV